MATELEREVETLIEHASKQFRNRFYTEANRTYESILLKLDSVDQITKQKYTNCIMSLQALTLSHLKQNDKALELYDRVIDRNPLQVSTLLRRGVLYMNIGDYQKSCADLQRALILEPDNNRIQFYIQELNEKISEMNQNADIKYPLKRRISQIVRLPEVQEEMLLNFSNLKLIDKQSTISSKSVSILNQPTATIQIVREFDMNTLIAALVKEVVLTPEQIREIQKQTQVELEPRRLEEELHTGQNEVIPVKISYDSDNDPQSTESILRSSTNSNLVSETSSDLTETNQKQKRISALQVKDIDGKVLKNSGIRESENKKSSEDKSNQINFGDIEDIQRCGKKQIPNLQMGMIKRKSSMRKGSSILSRPQQKSQFIRQKIDLSTIKIDGDLVRHQENKEIGEVVSQVVSKQSHHVTIVAQASNIETSGAQRSNCSKQEQELPPMIGLGDLKRKSSILKNSKHRFQNLDQQNFNINQ